MAQQSELLKPQPSHQGRKQLSPILLALLIAFDYPEAASAFFLQNPHPLPNIAHVMNHDTATGHVTGPYVYNSIVSLCSSLV